MKVLFFTADFSAENRAFAKTHKLIMRNVHACHTSDFIEQCDMVCGDVPPSYQHYPIFELEHKPLDLSKLKVDELKARLVALNVEIPPDVKKDDLVKLLEKAQAENYSQTQ